MFCIFRIMPVIAASMASAQEQRYGLNVKAGGSAALTYVVYAYRRNAYFGTWSVILRGNFHDNKDSDEHRIG